MAYNPVNQKMVNNIITNNNTEIIEIKDIPVFDKEDYEDLKNPKEYNKYIQEIKKCCRGSFEYKQMMSYLKQYMDMNQCSFLQGVSNETNRKIKIHIHHSPITMEEIIIIVQSKREYYMESLDTEQVAKEVMYLHYLLIIGLIPLSETPHELVHSGYLFVPNDKVFGNYKYFLEMYDQWIPAEMKVKFDNLEEYTKTYNAEKNSEILQLNCVYVNIEDQSTALPTWNDIMNLTRDRMNYNNLLANSGTTDIIE